MISTSRQIPSRLYCDLVTRLVVILYNLAMTCVLVSKNYEVALDLLRVVMMWWADTEGFRKGDDNVD